MFCAGAESRNTSIDPGPNPSCAVLSLSLTLSLYDFRILIVRVLT